MWGRGRLQRTYKCMLVLSPSQEGSREHLFWKEQVTLSLVCFKGHLSLTPRSISPRYSLDAKALSVEVTLLSSSTSKATILGNARLNLQTCTLVMPEPFPRGGIDDIRLSLWELSHRILQQLYGQVYYY